MRQFVIELVGYQRRPLYEFRAEFNLQIAVDFRTAGSIFLATVLTEIPTRAQTRNAHPPARAETLDNVCNQCCLARFYLVVSRTHATGHLCSTRKPYKRRQGQKVICSFHELVQLP